MRRFCLHIVLLSMLLAACGPEQNRENNRRSGPEAPGKELYAEKFSLQSQGNLTLLHVYTPWQNAAETKFSYLVGNDPREVPDSLAEIPFIQTPVEKTVIMSTTFVGFLDTLEVAHTITGVSGGRYIYDPVLYERYLEGKIREVGYDQQLNYELLMELDPDVVFLFGVQSGIVQTVNKLRETGIPVVICADYLEPHPLGRAEWIRFFAAFYDKQELAETIFRNVSYRYDSIAAGVIASLTEVKISGEQQVSENARTVHNKATNVSGVTPKELSPEQEEKTGPSQAPPVVMLGLPWKDTWYVAGGRSFAAKLISDAGGTYLFSDHLHAEAKPYDIEAVFSRAVDADVWINPGVATTMDEILEHDPRFEKLEVFRAGAVFNNNKRFGHGGGNDYWESGVVCPDLILEDLVYIFNGHHEDSSELYFYRKLD